MNTYDVIRDMSNSSRRDGVDYILEMLDTLDKKSLKELSDSELHSYYENKFGGKKDARAEGEQVDKESKEKKNHKSKEENKDYSLFSKNITRPHYYKVNKLGYLIKGSRRRH